MTPRTPLIPDIHEKWGWPTIFYKLLFQMFDTSNQEFGCFNDHKHANPISIPLKFTFLDESPSRLILCFSYKLDHQSTAWKFPKRNLTKLPEHFFIVHTDKRKSILAEADKKEKYWTCFWVNFLTFFLFVRLPLISFSIKLVSYVIFF